jgi:DNA-binding IclR family transcriptional regulator
MGISGGLQLPLAQSAAGWVLLSTVQQPRRDGMVRRLNAEAAEDRKFSAAEMGQLLQTCRDKGHAEGPAGFGSNARVLARLLPVGEGEHPLAVGFVHSADEQINTDSLLSCIDEAIRQTVGVTGEAASVELFATAA